VVAVSTGGASPVLARRIRIQIERLLPRSLGALARFLGRIRSRVAARIRNPDARRKFHEALIEGPVRRALDAGRVDLAEQRLKHALNAATETRPGRVTLAGAGPGDPELLTLKALACLQRADVIVHDGLVSEPVLDLARRDARRISVAKRSGDHSATQSEINALLIDLARAGKEVVRLKGGDPFIFGRGGEEAQALRAAGIDYEIVPGITAASGCAAYAGLPLTHRDHATGLRLVTAHCKGSRDNLNWRALAAEPQTLAFYMGAASLGRIQSRLLAHGRDPNTPVAIVENGTRPEQRVLGGRLTQLKALGDFHQLRSPAMVFVGEVAALALELSWYGQSPLTLSENPLASTAG
jgi:uroporphyrin-III C-methyltransferase/precorrin-2 dehydrogenase/sirohydrochlorin ferrochelatase